MQLSLAGNRELLALAAELEGKGEPYAVATVVARRAPVSSHLGDKAVIRADGTLAGWIGGSCSQPVVRREALEAMQTGQPRLVRLQVTEEEAAAAGAAGVERPADQAAAAQAPEGEKRVAMACPSGGEVEIFIEPHLRRPRVLGIGETPVVRALAEMASVAGFEAEVLTGPQLDPERVGPGDFVVVASAGHYDEDGVAAALRTRAGYVALVASRKRAAAVRAYLAEAGVPAEALGRVRNPAGLDIRAATQEEVAVSILAEIIQVNRTRPLTGGGEVVVAAKPALAKDPVCGMEVEVAAARHTYEYEGQTYYFCCPHCRAAFVKDPGAYLSPVGG